MSSMKDILQRYDTVIESGITPVSTSNKLNKQQQSVPQLPALFKPKSISVLKSPKDPSHPMKGYAVGAGESKDLTKSMASEDLISKVKKKLGDYLQDVAAAVTKDPDLQDKINSPNDVLGPAVKTVTTDDGHEIKIHGNEDDGFRISIKNRPGSTRFGTLDEATMACEMYQHHRRHRRLAQDYLEEK